MPRRSTVSDRKRSCGFRPLVVTSGCYNCSHCSRRGTKHMRCSAWQLNVRAFDICSCYDFDPTSNRRSGAVVEFWEETAK